MGKFLLAKAGGIVYNYSTHQTFDVMKKYLLPLAVAACCGFSTASATDAEHVQVTLKAKNSDLKVETISTPTPGVDVFNTRRSDASAPWYCLRIPVTVEGKGGGAKGPNFVDKLKVHVYAVFTAGKGEDPVLLDKEITYVEIPLTPSSSDKPSKGEMNVGVFISPSNAAKILGDGNGKLDFSNKLAAVAIEATHHDNPCMNTKEDQAVVVSHELESRLNGKWWKKTAKHQCGAVLNAISETPFAPFYAPAFPATSPLYGPADGAAGAVPSSTGGMSTSGTSDTDSSADTTTETEDDSAAETTGKGSKKGKKNKKNK